MRSADDPVASAPAPSAILGTIWAVVIVVFVSMVGVRPAIAAKLIDDGTGDVVLEGQGSSLRETLDALLSGRSIAVEWLDENVATQPVSEVLKGSVEKIFRQLVRETNFVAVYKNEGDSHLGLSRLIIVGKGQPGSSLDTVAAILGGTVAPLSADQKLRLARELRQQGISDDDLARRRAGDPNWAVGREYALQNQLDRTATASTFANGNPGQNNSAGFPTYFVPPVETAVDHHAAQAQALTLQMARRGLLALQEGLQAAGQAVQGGANAGQPPSSRK